MIHPNLTSCNALQHTTVRKMRIARAYSLQHTATHCNTLQHTATHCNTLRHTATLCDTLQHTATHCNTLQHIATHCNTLQHTATHCTHDALKKMKTDRACSLQHIVTHCNTLQHTTTHCNTRQHTATHTSEKDEDGARLFWAEIRAKKGVQGSCKLLWLHRACHE